MVPGTRGPAETEKDQQQFCMPVAGKAKAAPKVPLAKVATSTEVPLCTSYAVRIGQDLAVQHAEAAKLPESAEVAEAGPVWSASHSVVTAAMLGQTAHSGTGSSDASCPAILKRSRIADDRSTMQPLKRSRGCQAAPGALPRPPAEAFRRSGRRRRFLARLQELLGQLSPPRRRAAIGRLLTEALRLELEAWLIAGGGRRKLGATAEWGDSGRRPAAKVRKNAALKVPSRSISPVDDAEEGNDWRGGAGRRGVAAYVQRSRASGRLSRWYFSSVCLPGLHIVARLRRRREEADGDHRVLAEAKRRAALAAAEGRSVEEALEGALRGRLPRLRFYAAVSLAGGYRALVRSPRLRELPAALDARRRLLGARGERRVAAMAHAECEAMLERLRRELARLAAEHAPGRAGARALAAFEGAGRRLLEGRDAAALARLARLLGRKEHRAVGSQKHSSAHESCAEGHARLEVLSSTARSHHQLSAPPARGAGDGPPAGPPQQPKPLRVSDPTACLPNCPLPQREALHASHEETGRPRGCRATQGSMLEDT